MSDDSGSGLRKSWETHILQPSGNQSGRNREESDSYSPKGETQYLVVVAQTLRGGEKKVVDWMFW